MALSKRQADPADQGSVASSQIAGMLPNWLTSQDSNYSASETYCTTVPNLCNNRQNVTFYLLKLVSVFIFRIWEVDVKFVFSEGLMAAFESMSFT
jgi:hypothetical protein